MLDSAYALRYQVYCLERGFLPPADYPDGRETDEHDDASVHFGAYADGQELVGYVRLVQPHPGGGFPFESHCGSLLADAVLPDASCAAEVSRLMVRQDYRSGRRKSLRRVDAHDVAPVEAAQPSEAGGILLEMYRRMYGYSLDNGITHWYAAMERSLARSLRRWNFGFTQISAETDYFGPVALYVADLRDIERRLAASSPNLLDWLRAPQPAAELAPANDDGWATTAPPLWQVRQLRGGRPARGGRAMAGVARTGT